MDVWCGGAVKRGAVDGQALTGTLGQSCLSRSAACPPPVHRPTASLGCCIHPPARPAPA